MTAETMPPGTATYLVKDSAPGQVFDVVGAALAAARRLRSATPSARVALYTGVSGARAERLCDIALPGQILLCARTADLLGAEDGDLGPLHDLGQHRLRDLSPPLRLFQYGGTPARPDSLDAVPNNLPVHLTSFVGRTAELGSLRGLLAAHQLLTLTGVGGSGKTRLAAQIAAASASRWPGGIWWVDLTSVTDAGQVAAAVAEAAGVLVDPALGSLRSIGAQLTDAKMLLCLDNCERVLDGAAELAELVLRGCPEVSLLTTSREPLRIPGELAWPVPPLAMTEARELFVNRAGVSRTEQLSHSAADAAIRRICARLDGIPLAVELAAAWLDSLTPSQIESGLADRFGLLVRGPRGVVSRHQTLAASVDYSHELLDAADRLVFRELSVFAGGFTLDAAHAVCADSVRGALARLVDKSLLLTSVQDGQARYRMLESIREYAADRLAEQAQTAHCRSRHLGHYLALVEQAVHLRETDLHAWWRKLAAEQDNLHAAVEFGLSETDPERGRRLCAELAWMWHLQPGSADGMSLLRRAVESAPNERSELQARLLAGACLVVDTTSPLDQEYDAARRAIDLATEIGSDTLRALGLNLAAVGQLYIDFDAARDLAEQAHELAQRTADPFNMPAARALQAIVCHLRDEHAEADERLGAVLGGLRRRHPGIAATVTSFQASGALYTGQLARSRGIAEESVALAQPFGDYLRIGGARSVLAGVHGMAGDSESGLRELDPVLRLVQAAPAEVFVPGLARAMGTLELLQDNAAEALRWFEREAWSTDRGAPTYLAAQARPGLGAALRRLGRVDEAQRVLATATTLADQLGMPKVYADALEQQAHLTADPDHATELHHRALAIRFEHGLLLGCLDTMESLATALARAGKCIEAMRVTACCTHTRSLIGYPRQLDSVPAAAETRSLARKTLDDVEIAAAVESGMALDVAEAVGYLRRARGTRSGHSTGWQSLTRTELEVVRLVAAGLNNPQVGAKLFITRGTVKTHLSHVYAKLGVANRTELAALAARQRDSEH